jgi:hypothetical protein
VGRNRNINAGLTLWILVKSHSMEHRCISKETTDLLNAINQPAGAISQNVILANIGQWKTRGVEFNLNAGYVMVKAEFIWDATSYSS